MAREKNGKIVKRFINRYIILYGQAQCIIRTLILIRYTSS